jgi:poly(A) polymerase/tRNA nucleotidyltransferase (CCA-adding enzyme)
LLLGRQVRDWDLATAAPPERVKAAFPHTVDTGLAHGTVTVVNRDRHVEITTFRTEGPYLDGRRPSTVSFNATLQEDLVRRDFTINAMALGRPGGSGGSTLLTDPARGLDDLSLRIVRTAGDPGARFAEDHLRILRAFRIAAELNFDLDPETEAAAARAAATLGAVAAERVRDELSRILVTPGVAAWLERLRSAGIIAVLIPELEAGYRFEQNEYHPHDVWYHSILTCGSIEPVLHLRLAGLLHDIAKPAVLSVDGEGRRHFYGHELAGADMAAGILRRLRYDKDLAGRVTHLIRMHMDLHDLPPEAGDAAVRRMAARIGREHIGDLLRLRKADRGASGKAGPASRGTLEVLARLAALDRADTALKVTDLRTDGRRVMEVSGLTPGPEVGRILHALLEAVLEDPSLNNPSDLDRLALRFAAQPSGREGHGGNRTQSRD